MGKGYDQNVQPLSNPQQQLLRHCACLPTPADPKYTYAK